MKKFLFFLLSVSPVFLFSQQLILNRRTEIPVYENGQALRNPWAGGLNNPQFSEFDLDRNGVMDLVLFDRADNSISTFLNRGALGLADYDYAPIYIDSFPEKEFYGWLQIHDFNHDGYADLFTCDPTSKIRVFKNTTATTGNLSFQLYTDPVNSNYPPFLILYAAHIDIPSITDIDRDGDLDVLTFDVLGGSVEYHKNVSVESGWGYDSLRFQLQSFCFGHFHESGLTCTAFLNDPPCGTGMIHAGHDDMSALRAAHSGSTLLALDLDANGLKDLVVGDIGCESFYALRNGGSVAIAHFDSLEENFPSANVPARIPMFPAGFYLDLNNDGIKDLAGAPNLVGDSENEVGVWWYRNNGNDSFPDFQFQDSGFIQNTMIETGSGSAPSFFDFDGDSLLDLMVGNLWYYTSPPGNKTSLSLYRNMGTAEVPRYELWNQDFLGLSSHPSFSALDNLTPAFADIDNDGDEDLFFGESIGGINYFENIANPGDTANYVFVTSNFQNIYAGANPAPVFKDLDGDTDLDMVIGNRKGLLTYYENQGSVTAPNMVKITDSLGMVVLGSNVYDGYSRPCFSNMDSDPDDELLVGKTNGVVNIYDNISPAPGAVFNLVDSFPNDYGSYVTVAAGVIDTSGNTTFVIGNQRGGLQLIGKEINIPISIAKSPDANMGKIQIYPNPTRHSFNIAWDVFPRVKELQVSLLDLSGKTIAEFAAQNGLRLEAPSLAPGIYLLECEADGKRITGKLRLE